MAHIQLLGTGGTIASRGGYERGAVATDVAADLVQGQYGEMTVLSRDVLTTGSYLLGLRELRLIAEAVQEAVADVGTDGVVVTHGTDTLEETAFLLELVHDSPKTVVLTGAQRPADSPSPDGPHNVEEAVLAAASPELHDSGVLISFGGAVRTARGARKAHTTACSPFQGGVEVAHFAGHEIVVTARPARRAPLPLPPVAFDAIRVEIVAAYTGATPQMFEAAVADGAHAVVIAGTGVGNAGPGFVEAVKRAIEAGCVVVLSTRAPWGPVVPMYGNGGGVDLVAAGAVPSGDLNPFQARVLAALLISLGASSTNFAHEFKTYF